MMRSHALALCILIASAGVAGAAEELSDGDPAGSSAATEQTPKTICALIESAAATHGIPIDFFTRLIWKESAFRQNAVSPRGAQGIAQFMPATAALRELVDPFDPVEAIPASAHYLKDLVGRFGDLGVAAGAYNAGEERVARWLAGDGGLPWETQDYVLAITGRTIDDWSRPEPVLPTNAALPTPIPALPTPQSNANCLTIAAALGKPGAGADLVASITPAAWALWGVQVAGNFSLNRAMVSYSGLQKRYGAVLGGQAPMIVRIINRSRGAAPLFQLRVPAGSRDQANAICKKLHALGGDCLVLRTH